DRRSVVRLANPRQTAGDPTRRSDGTAARPEFRPPWSLRSHHSVISLAPLDRVQVRQMVGELASLHALSKEVMDGVSERTGGVPLFIDRPNSRRDRASRAR